MFRLLFGKEKEVFVNNHGQFNISEKFPKYTEKNSKDLETKVSAVPVLKSYKDFLDKIKKDSEYSLDGLFILFFKDDTIYLFKQILYNNLVLITTYKPENTKMYNLLEALFAISPSKEYALVECNKQTNYSLLVSWDILNVIITKEYLNSINTPLYTKFKLKSKNGKIRDIIAPNNILKETLQNLNVSLQHIYDKRNLSFQVAYKKGKNVKSGAILHTNDKYVYNLDLHNFYPSCKKEIVRQYIDFFFNFCYNREYVENEFFDVVFIDGGLFIGSPISGVLANTVISNPVKCMNNICKKYNVNLSVYADDICFSSNKFISKSFVENIFNKSFETYELSSYFVLNEKKSVGFSGCNRKITGVAINNSNKITVPRGYYRLLRTKIDHLSKNDSSINIEKLRGQIAYATMLDDSGKIFAYLKKYKSTVQKYNLCSQKIMASL